MIQKYVVGFMLDFAGEFVLLLEKQKPDWQKGFLNGPGGKIEKIPVSSAFFADLEESSEQAMTREFFEETNIKTHPYDWNKFVTAKFPDSEIDFFYCFSDQVFNYGQPEEEKLDLYKVKELSKLKTIPNLQWMIPLILDIQFNNWVYKICR